MRSTWNLPICNGSERLKEKGKKVHSTQKPESLLHRILLASSNKNDLILDPFCGSGTTAIAALNLDINCITTDVNPDAISIAQGSVDEVSQEMWNPLLDIL